MSTMTYDGRTYTNGNVPSAILEPLDPRGKHGTSGTQEAYLRADAAEAWNRAVAEVEAKTGLVLTVRGWNRSYAEQVTFFHRAYSRHSSGGYDVRWFQGVRYARRSGKASAAIPGNSNHGWGLAVDVNDFGGVGQWSHPRRKAAMPTLAEHGWTDTEGRQSHVDEPWHLVYDPSKDKHRGKDWFDMASKADLRAIVRDVVREEIDGVARDVMQYPIKLGGATARHVDAESVTAATMLRYAGAAVYEGRDHQAEILARLDRLEGKG